MLQRCSITYSQIGKRFGITRERVRQIRQKFIASGVSVADRYVTKDRNNIVKALKNSNISNQQILECFNITEYQLDYIRQIARAKGYKFPTKYPKSTSIPKIIELFNRDKGPKYGRCKRIATILGVSQQYILNEVCRARKKGLL